MFVKAETQLPHDGSFSFVEEVDEMQNCGIAPKYCSLNVVSNDLLCGKFTRKVSHLAESSNTDSFAFEDAALEKDLSCELAHTVPYVVFSMPRIEEVFFRFYNHLLQQQLHKKVKDPVFQTYDSELFPLLKSRTVGGFFVWLREMVVYKHYNYIPDALVRGVMIRNAGLIDDEDLNMWVEVVTRVLFGFVWYPIEYRYLFQLEKKLHTREDITSKKRKGCNLG